MPPLYLIEQGAAVHCDGERLSIRKADEVLQTVPLVKVDQVVVFGNIQLSTPAIKRLLDLDIDVAFLTQHGRFRGRLVGDTPPHVALRRMQYRRADEQGWSFEVARALVRGKLRNCRALLQRYQRDRVAPPPALRESIEALHEVLGKVEGVQGRSALMGLEGFGAKRYFNGLRALLDADWGFTSRERRPPPDPVNVLLSLGYTLLLSNVVYVIETVGLDPYLGFLHTETYNRPSLALDLMEEFRPLLVDMLVLRCCNEKLLSRDDFTPSDDPARPIVLGNTGKRAFIQAFEDRLRKEVLHPDGAGHAPGRVPYRRCIELQVRQLARAIQQGDVYQPFGAR